jgi:hypothetical protein
MKTTNTAIAIRQQIEGATVQNEISAILKQYLRDIITRLIYKQTRTFAMQRPKNGEVAGLTYRG